MSIYAPTYHDLSWRLIPVSSLLDEESLSVAEAAARLKVNKSTVWRWIDSGRLPAYRIGERRVRLKKTDVEGLIMPARATDREGDTVRRRLTKDEQSQALAAVEQAMKLQADLLTRRGGEYFSPPSWELLAEARALRDQQRA